MQTYIAIYYFIWIENQQWRKVLEKGKQPFLRICSQDVRTLKFKIYYIVEIVLNIMYDVWPPNIALIYMLYIYIKGSNESLLIDQLL